MEVILNLFQMLYPKLDFTSEDENLKNKITVIFIISSMFSSLIYCLISLFYNITFLFYSCSVMTAMYLVAYLINLKGKVHLSKVFYIQITNILTFITVLFVPKETSFNILYAVIFFTIFSIYELKDQKEILWNAGGLIFSYVALEICMPRFVDKPLMTENQIDIIFYLNMIWFALGMLACIFFYLENNKKYREQLLETEENLNAVIENSQKAIWSVDNQLNILTMNLNFKKFAEIIAKVSPKRGDNVLNYLPQKSLNLTHWENICKSVLSGKQCLEELKIEYDGIEIYIEINLYPIKNAAKQITGIAFFGKDITKRKIHAELLNIKNNELLKANKELDLLVYRASHDLRAPLMSILGLIKITEIEYKETKGLINFELMTKSINKLDSYIKDIIDLSRNARTEIEYKEIEFEDMIDELVNSLVYFEHAEHIELIKNIKKSASFVSDPKRIEIILNNLISNSIKYHNIHQDFPFIRIDIEQNYKEAIVVISDNGLGIEEEHIEHIFNMFYRASSNSKGSGLGLYIVKDAIGKLKGKIELQSAFGKGTTFKITIPNHVIEQ